ncbi:unnamed protein product [Bursaphelenchus xylophilus]|uniref:(pine wood nematode) hypothetical protein n=1 Tax=Bursaphelenchus xylophilus TaxID=6326 RepID=A0A1I7RZD4_BURXY|nr:unnamed protein product [Bursaphelenchus xylophilus]CAG9106564.1 unnamed protein product [Bursaphelenchus xylophilus]
MGYSKEELENLLKVSEDAADVAVELKDHEGISKLYHEDAVLIHSGSNATYGRKAIADNFVQLMKLFDKFVLKKGDIWEVNDAEYIVRKGEFRFDDNPKWMTYIQFYKRSEDGNYLIVYDKFDL